MIRVLQVVQQMGQGGAETFLMNLYRHVDRSRIQFDFLTHSKTPGFYDREIQELGGKMYTVPTRREGVLQNRRALDLFFQQHPEYRIVHAHMSSLSYVEPLLAAAKHGVPVRIAHSHSTREGGSPLHYLPHRYHQSFLESYITDCFACSDLAGRWMFGNKQFETGKVTIIPNGIEAEKFRYSPQIRDEVRAKLHIGDELVIGHVGRFVPAKNHNFLLHIFAEIIRKSPNAVLILAGDGPLRPLIEDLASTLQIRDQVLFMGSRDDISNLMQAIDIFLFPSLYEGLPVTLVEAQASGLPCLVSSVVTKQVALTSHLQYMDIDAQASDWAAKTLSMVSDIRSSDTSPIVQAGFEISDIAAALQSFYEKSFANRG